MIKQSKYLTPLLMLLAVTVFVSLTMVQMANAANPAVGYNGVQFTALSSDVCPSSNASCIRANAGHELIAKIQTQTAYLVAVSPSPSPGQSLTYGAAGGGIWVPGAGGGGGGGGGGCTAFSGWTACTFNAGWSNFGSGFATCGWYVDGCTGRVYFKGVVQGSCAGSTFITQLTTSQTPKQVIGQKTRWDVSGDGAVALEYIELTTDGKLSPATGGTCSAVVLDSINYLGEL